MFIRTLWGLRKGETTPELLLAWDEFCVDENFDGWDAAAEEICKKYASTMQTMREVNVGVDMRSLDKILSDTPHIDGTIENEHVRT